ncbi:MAG: biopolymer transporter ExbD [Phycisphaerales bacterium]
MRFGRARIPEEASFDLTPMIDVILLLIIFFMFTTHFAKTQLRPMDLPREKGERTAQDSGKASIVIDLAKDGQMSVLGTDTDLPSLVRMVQGEVLRLGASLDLVIRADRACPAAHLNRLADGLAGVGVRDWKLATAGEGAR